MCITLTSRIYVPYHHNHEVLYLQCHLIFNPQPLHRAIITNNQSLTSLLLLNGANCRLQDIDGQTPLHKACEKGYTDIAVMLMKRDRPLLEIKDNKGRTPTECCASEEMKIIIFKVGSEKS